jgi:hypothetical protein
MTAGAVTVALVILWVCNLIDTVATLYYTQAGLLVEINPIMAALLESPPAFVCVKIVGMTAICGYLWMFRRFKIARCGAFVGAVVYIGLAIYYAVVTAFFA